MNWGNARRLQWTALWGKPRKYNMLFKHPRHALQVVYETPLRLSGIAQRDTPNVIQSRGRAAGTFAYSYSAHI